MSSDRRVAVARDFIRGLMLHALPSAVDGAATRLVERLDAVDDLRGPLEELRDKVPVVLYFRSREDADEFVAAASGAFVNPIVVRT